MQNRLLSSCYYQQSSLLRHKLQELESSKSYCQGKGLDKSFGEWKSVSTCLNPLQAKNDDETSTNTCKAYKTGGDPDITSQLFGDEDLEDMVLATRTEGSTFYFDGKICGDNPALNGDGTNLVYTAQVGTYVHDSDNAVLTEPAMLFSDITCKYDEDLTADDIKAPKGFELDPEEDDKDDQVGDDQGDLGITPTVYKKGTLI